MNFCQKKIVKPKCQIMKKIETLKSKIESLIITIFVILDGGQEITENSRVVPIPLNYNILRKVFQWCTQHHHDLEKTIGHTTVDEENGAVELPEWDHTFFQSMTDNTLVELILAANYLQIEVRFYIGPFIYTIYESKTPLSFWTLGLSRF